MEKKKEYTLYKWRWLIMLGYCLISTGVAQSNVSFVAVSNILQKYYRINIFAVNILTLLYTATVLLFTFPFAFLLHRYELAVVMKLSAVLNVIGTVVRYFAANQNGYIYLVTGSVLSAFAFTGYAFIPAKLAGNWFGEKEIGLATSICIGKHDKFSFLFYYSYVFFSMTTNNIRIRHVTSSLLKDIDRSFMLKN